MKANLIISQTHSDIGEDVPRKEEKGPRVAVRDVIWGERCPDDRHRCQCPQWCQWTNGFPKLQIFTRLLTV